ncbi:MAG: hypothetical protein ABFS34_10975 [Gemmatimonadota bacterium]
MTGFKRLIHEIHRRSLWQVLAIYLAGSWMAFEAVGEIGEAAGLPDWVPSFALILLVIGLPIVLATAFVQEGVGASRRAVAGRATAGDAASPDPGATPTADAVAADAAAPRSPEGRAGLFTWRNAVLGGMGGFTLLGIATAVSMVLGVAAGDARPEVDRNAVVVLPFRATGQDIEFLSEGMLDLLAAQLTGEGGPRALDSRTVLAGLRARRADGGVGLPRDEALALARQLGAGNLLMGEVVGVGQRLTITATLVDASEESEVRAQVDGPQDSLPALVDALARELLAEWAGFDPARVAALSSTTMPAVRAWLDGMRAYRGGEFLAASEAFARSLEADTAFALAGLMLYWARGWEGQGPEYELGLRVAWQGREFLPPPDRALVEALVGPEWPELRLPVEQLQSARDIVERWPRYPEAWYYLGDRYYHWGGELGVADARDEAARMFERALDLEPAFAPAMNHLLQLAAESGDRTRTRELADVYFAERVDADRSALGLEWIAAIALGDTAWLAALEARFDDFRPVEAFQIAFHVLRTGTGLNEADRAVAGLEESVIRAIDPFGLYEYYVARARPAEGRERLLGSVPPAFRGGADMFYATVGTVAPARGDAAAEALEAFVASVPPEQAPEFTLLLRCLAALWWASSGQAERAEATSEELEAAFAALETEAGPDESAPELCLLSLDVLLLRESGTTAALERTAERLDSLALNGSLPDGFTTLANFVLMLEFETLGDYERAGRAAERMHAGPAFAGTVLAHARFAARRGDVDTARRYYTHFLSLRDRPEPGFQTELTAQASAELAALLEPSG